MASRSNRSRCESGKKLSSSTGIIAFSDLAGIASTNSSGEPIHQPYQPRQCSGNREMTLHAIARRHCVATGNRLTLSGFVQNKYSVGLRYFERVSTGKKKPSAKLLRAMAATHVRLFPTEPVILELPNHPPVILGHNSTTK